MDWGKPLFNTEEIKYILHELKASKRHLFKHFSYRVISTLGDQEDTIDLELMELKEGQMVKIGGKGFSTGLNDGLCVKFIITTFKYY